MTCSEMTDAQIEKAVDLYREVLREHRSEFGPELAQLAIDEPGYVVDLLTVLRNRVEAAGRMVVRTVKVDRTKEPQAMLDASSRKQYVSADAVKSMPRGEHETVTVVIFQVGRFIDDAELDREYERRGLVPADPYTLVAVNEADPSLTDTRPNATRWKDSAGKRHYIAIARWGGERRIDINSGDHTWDGIWWHAGIHRQG